MSELELHTGEIIQPLGHDEARRLTERIRILATSVQESIDKLGGLIVAAYEQRAWIALGYETWDSYVAAEFGTNRLRLDRDDRQQVVVQLRSAGMSTRAIVRSARARAGCRPWTATSIRLSHLGQTTHRTR